MNIISITNTKKVTLRKTIPHEPVFFFPSLVLLVYPLKNTRHNVLYLFVIKKETSIPFRSEDHTQ